MNKRGFLAVAAATGLAQLPSSVQATQQAPAGPGLLTVSGDVGRSNRGPLDPALDQMMVKHDIHFTRAWVLDAQALRRLPTRTIRPVLEYDQKPHTLSGPLLADVLRVAGVKDQPGVQLALRAVDGYAAPVTLVEAVAWNMIVALDIDGSPLALGGLGPQWAVYDPQALAAFKDKPLSEQFAKCPWGLYSIEVKAV